MTPPAEASVAVVGSGSLARVICYSIAASVPAPLSVSVVARDGDALAELCHVATVRAGVSAQPVTFTPVRADVLDADHVAEILAAYRFAGVLVCASLHSPWEGRTAASAWTRLLEEAGLGLTLPLQAMVPLAVARAANDCVRPPFVLNACLPDAVNPLLSGCGYPVLAGIGNVAVLEASARVSLGLDAGADLRVLAHHYHLRAPRDPSEEALLWQGLEPVPATEHLSGHRSVSRHEANQITGHHAARLLAELAFGGCEDVSLPGPLGLPGGYPVRITSDEVMLRLPDSLPDTEAVRLNQRWAAMDGAVVGPDWVRFGSSAQNRLRDLLPALAQGFAPRDVAKVARQLGELRTKLREMPATCREYASR